MCTIWEFSVPFLEEIPLRACPKPNSEKFFLSKLGLGHALIAYRMDRRFYSSSNKLHRANLTLACRGGIMKWFKVD